MWSNAKEDGKQEDIAKYRPEPLEGMDEICN
jgi:hypothetical protein